MKIVTRAPGHRVIVFLAWHFFSRKRKDILKRIQKFKSIAKYKDVEGSKDEWYYQ